MNDTQQPSKQPVDLLIRERALNTNHSFAVSAPAGSGKTGLLTQRVLALLAQCDEPENVLAITFTRKAAAEMQNRIVDALHKAQQQTEEPEAEYEKATWHLARAVLQRNHDKKWQLLSCPNRLRITTIDGLCRAISQQMPFASQLGSTPEILEQVDSAYRMAAREVLKQLHKPGDLQSDLIRLVKHFNNQLEQIETLFIQLLAKRDQWLSIIFRSKDQRELLESMLVEVIEEHLNHTQQSLQSLQSELILLADYAASNLQNSSSPIKACLGLTELPATTTAAIPQWLGLAELLLTQKGELRKSANKAIGFLAPSDKSLSTEQKQRAKEYKQRMAELLTRCHSDTTIHKLLTSKLHQVRRLPSPYYAEKQWQLLDSLTHILVSLASHLTLSFQQLGKTDYLAVTLAALEALGDSDQPTDLALALDYKIQHILVDEFQDTSTTQLELLQRLTAGWQTGDGRTLFIVGDAMQSCYRFRDANVGLFLNIRQQGIGDIRLEALDLQVNFRSQQGIVDWVNQHFASIFPTENNSYLGAVRYKPSISVKPALAVDAVQTHILAYHETLLSRQHEANTVVDIIQHTQQQRPQDSIALLVRNKAHAKTIIEVFNQAGIAYQAKDIDRLNTCMPVLDLLSLTKALLYPQDHMAWLAVLRAPWCGLNMHDLHKVVNYCTDDDKPASRSGNSSQQSTQAHQKINKKPPLLVRTLCDNSLLEPLAQQLSASGRQKLIRFSQIIIATVAQQKRHSLRHWLHGCWLALGGPGLLINPINIDNITTFFSLLERYEQGGTIPHWNDLEAAVNQLYATNSHHLGNAVQIMSIHKSKGLEFDTVIIPGLDKKPRSADKELLLWLERVGYSKQSHQQERQLLISPVNATGDNKDSIYQFIQQQQTEKDQLESDRLLYVACTRAIKQLHLIAYAKTEDKTIDNQQLTIEQLKEPSQHSLLSRLWRDIGHHCQVVTVDNIQRGVNQQQPPPSQSNALSHPNKIASLPNHWQAPQLKIDTLLKKYRGNNLLATLANSNTTLSKEDPKNPTNNTNIASPDTLYQREQRYIGIVIHLALQQITLSGAHHWDHKRVEQQTDIWRTQLLQQGMPPHKLHKSLDTIRQAINNTLTDETGLWLLDNSHSHSATELALWNNQGQHIIDRTFIVEDKSANKKKVRWIIDYKSSKALEGQTLSDFLKAETEHYQAQLKRYAELFKHEGIPINTALYFPLYSLFHRVELPIS